MNERDKKALDRMKTLASHKEKKKDVKQVNNYKPNKK